MYDVLVVGGGPAGLTAALYCARRSLRTLIVSKDLGGQAATTTVIENYPGVGAIDGFELMQRFQQQALDFGAEYVIGEVQSITREANAFTATYGEANVQARSIILAFGLTPRGLNIPGENHLTGKGVYYSAAPLVNTMHNKTVMVVGGGNSAIESVNLLADVAKKVYLVHRRDRFRAEAILVRKMESHSNVEPILKAQLVAVSGDEQVSAATVQTDDGNQKTVSVDGVFLNIGFMSKTGLVEDLVVLNEKNEIQVEANCTTRTPGVFAAGDITTQNYKQVIVSAGEGCKAALACYAYIMALDGKTVDVDQDWDVTSGEHFIRT